MGDVVTGPPFGRTVPGNAWDVAVGDPAPDRTVSVVVTHFEQPDQLRRTLAALRRQTRPAEQIVVVDDGSEQAPECGPDICVVRQPDRGFRAAAARNLGASHARGELLVFLDADTAPEPAFLDAITELPQRLPELLAVGRRRHADLAATRSTTPDRPVEEAGPEHELTEPAWLRRGYADTADLRHADATSHRFVISSVLACTTWWFESLGGFDERFVGYGGEDWELAARSWRRGGLVAHVPAAVAWHDGPAAGESGRPGDDVAALDQTLAVADRIGAPGASYRGVLAGPPDLVVTVDDAFDRRQLIVTLDSLLAALPRSRVALAAPAASWLPDDPRVIPALADDTDYLDTDFRLRLHLTAPVLGSVGGWAQVATLVDGTDPPATLRLTGSDGQPLGALLDLRQHRRARRWGHAGRGLVRSSSAGTDLRSADRVSLQAWLEGWV